MEHPHPSPTRAGPAVAEPEEARLLARLRSGDAQAFETLVRSTAGRLYAVALRLLRHEQDAADAVQEAFTQAYSALGRFRGEAAPATWLKRIVINACLMKLRRRARRPQVDIEDLLPRFAPDGHRLDPRGPWPQAADELLARREIREKVRANIDRLSDDHRTVLMLRDVEGFDTQQTARAIGIREGAVKTRLHRARMALRELMERDLVA